MNNKRVRTIIWILLCLALLRGIIYSSVIPFDRSPDESYNFRLIKARHLQLIHASEQERRQAAASLRMTTRYLQYPDAAPGKYSLADYADARLPQAPSVFHLYSLVGGWLLKLASLEHIRDEIYLIRGLSTLCGVLVVGLSFLVTRELFPDKPFLLIGVPLFLTFLPQFSAMNGVVSDDKLTEVFLALMFWVLVKIFKHGINWGYVFAWFLTALLALLSKRTAMFVFPLLPVMIIVYYWKSSLGIRLHLLLLGLLAGFAIGGYNLAWYIDEMGGFLAKYVIWIPTDKLLAVLAQSTSVAALKYYAKFFIVIYWSFWGVFGYMDIHLHHFWYVGAACAQCLALGGLGYWTYRLKTGKISCESWRVKVVYLFGASIVLVVLLMFLRSIILQTGDPMLAQGRRLFTVIIPVGILTVLGLENLFSPKYHRFVAGLAVAGLLVLDIVSLSNYIFLNFHLQSLFH